MSSDKQSQTTKKINDLIRHSKAVSRLKSDVRMYMESPEEDETFRADNPLYLMQKIQEFNVAMSHGVNSGLHRGFVAANAALWATVQESLDTTAEWEVLQDACLKAEMELAATRTSRDRAAKQKQLAELKKYERKRHLSVVEHLIKIDEARKKCGVYMFCWAAAVKYQDYVDYPEESHIADLNIMRTYEASMYENAEDILDRDGSRAKARASAKYQELDPQEIIKSCDDDLQAIAKQLKDLGNVRSRQETKLSSEIPGTIKTGLDTVDVAFETPDIATSAMKGPTRTDQSKPLALHGPGDSKAETTSLSSTTTSFGLTDEDKSEIETNVSEQAAKHVTIAAEAKAIAGAKFLEVSSFGDKDKGKLDQLADDASENIQDKGIRDEFKDFVKRTLKYQSTGVLTMTFIATVAARAMTDMSVDSAAMAGLFGISVYATDRVVPGTIPKAAVLLLLCGLFGIAAWSMAAKETSSDNAYKNLIISFLSTTAMSVGMRVVRSDYRVGRIITRSFRTFGRVCTRAWSGRSAYTAHQEAHSKARRGFKGFFRYFSGCKIETLVDERTENKEKPGTYDVSGWVKFADRFATGVYIFLTMGYTMWYTEHKFVRAESLLENADSRAANVVKACHDTVKEFKAVTDPICDPLQMLPADLVDKLKPFYTETDMSKIVNTHLKVLDYSLEAAQAAKDSVKEKTIAASIAHGKTLLVQINELTKNMTTGEESDEASRAIGKLVDDAMGWIGGWIGGGISKAASAAASAASDTLLQSPTAHAIVKFARLVESAVVSAGRLSGMTDMLAKEDALPAHYIGKMNIMDLLFHDKSFTVADLQPSAQAIVQATMWICSAPLLNRLTADLSRTIQNYIPTQKLVSDEFVQAIALGLACGGCGFIAQRTQYETIQMFMGSILNRPTKFDATEHVAVDNRFLWSMFGMVTSQLTVGYEKQYASDAVLAGKLTDVLLKKFEYMIGKSHSKDLDALRASLTQAKIEEIKLGQAASQTRALQATADATKAGVFVQAAALSETKNTNFKLLEQGDKALDQGVKSIELREESLRKAELSLEQQAELVKQGRQQTKFLGIQTLMQTIERSGISPDAVQLISQRAAAETVSELFGMDIAQAQKLLTVSVSNFDVAKSIADESASRVLTVVSKQDDRKKNPPQKSDVTDTDTDNDDGGDGDEPEDPILDDSDDRTIGKNIKGLTTDADF